MDLQKEVTNLMQTVTNQQIEIDKLRFEIAELKKILKKS